LVICAIAIIMAELVFAVNTYQEDKDMKHEVVIGTSVSIPVMGEIVEVDILPKFRKNGALLKIISPTDKTTDFELDKDGKVTWQPERYGKHLLTYDDHSRTIWVASRPVIFSWWTTETRPDFVTASMLAKEDSEEYWQRRGVIRLHWIGGEYLSREEHKVPFRHPQQWLNDWWGRLSEIANLPLQGVCLDEVYGTDERVDGIEIPKAVAMFRQKIGKDPAIGVYYSGITEEFSTGMWYLRQSNVYHLSESYWGTEEIYQKRWQDLKLYRLQERAMLTIAPGFNQSERVRGSLTPEELRDEFAVLRRVAPDAAGLGVFNAYKSPDLERLADKFIEDYFLKPTIHLQPHNGKLLSRNIGHEDADGFSITFLDDTGKNLQSIQLEKLKPMQSQEFDVPDKAKAVRVSVPQDSVEIYPDGIYSLPEVMNPPQVTGASIDNMAVVASRDGNFTFSARFNKPLNPNGVKNDSVILLGVISGQHNGQVSYDEKKHTLSISFKNLPADFYTLRLLSSKDNISDVEGLPLDGSGNGILDPLHDHYAVHFRLDRGNTKPILPLP